MRKRRVLRSTVSALAAFLFLLLNVTTPPHAAQAQQIGASQYNACDGPDLLLFSKDGRRVRIGFNAYGQVKISNGVVKWRCGAAERKARCPSSARTARIIRTHERRFELQCLK